MTDAAMPSRVAIILVNWNGWRDCVECLSSIVASDAMQTADVYLVDNASTDGSVEQIQAWCAEPRPVAPYKSFEGVRHIGPEPIAFRVWQANGQAVPRDATSPQLTLIHSGGNLGFAGGNNVGIVAAGLERYSHFWLLNTDTVIRHDALAPLLSRASAEPTPGLVGSSLIYYHEPELIQAMGGAVLNFRTAIANHIGDRFAVDQLPSDAAAIEAQMSYVVGASMFASREFIERVGLLQEDYFLYYEEADWAFRGGPRRALGYAPLSIVYHKVGGSSAQKLSEYSLNALYRSRLRFAARFLPQSLPWVRGMIAFEALRHAVKGRWMPARVAAKNGFSTFRKASLPGLAAPQI